MPRSLASFSARASPMKRSRLRRVLPATVFALVAIAGWYWLAPAQIGGSTTYVATNGISMEPRFHTGDLALVRPVSDYRVGEIVAYHSTLLHVVVLHRIIGRDGNRYVFKGDNNSFVDPTRPLRSELIGALWLRVPHGGLVLKILHTPVMVGVVLGIVGLLLLLGAGEARRRRRGRRQASVPSKPKIAPARRQLPSAGATESAAKAGRASALD